MPHIPSRMFDTPTGDAYGFDPALGGASNTWLDWVWVGLFCLVAAAAVVMVVFVCFRHLRGTVVSGMVMVFALVGGVAGSGFATVARNDREAAAAAEQREAFAEWAADVYGIEVDEIQARALLAGEPAAVTYLGYRNLITAEAGDGGLLYLFGANGIELAAAVGWVPGDTIDPEGEPPTSEQPDVDDDDAAADQGVNDQG